MREDYLQVVAQIDVSDIRTMMEAYGEDVWNYAYVLTRNAHSADDIAQETFIKAYRSFQSFRGESSVKTWLLRITRNTALSHNKLAYFRRVVLRDSVDDDPFSSKQSVSAEDEVIRQETTKEIWNVVLELPKKFRDPFVLSLHYQLSMEEISSILGLSVGTVKSRIYRAKNKVSAKLKGVHNHE